MVECDHCADDVFTVWRHQRAETTAPATSWFCMDCHPELSTTAREITPDSSGRTTTGGSHRRNAS